ncbi:MAG: hypothetical protein JW706_08610, partial [Opitutales bacterium]|nr:hypothetical protein [Opitutales bacterium]
PKDRVEIIKRRIAFEKDPEQFSREWSEQSTAIANRIARGMELLPHVEADDSILDEIVRRSLDTGVDGHRSDIIMLKASKTLAAWHGRTTIIPEDVQEAAELTLAHRIRRQPFEGM